MTLNKIQDAVIDRVEAAKGLLPVKCQGKTFSHEGQPYAEMIITPLTTQSETIDGGDIMRGYIQFNVYSRKNDGAYYGAEEGQRFVDLFPRDLEFDGVKITNTGTIKSLVDDNAWPFTPVLIEYEADSCQRK